MPASASQLVPNACGVPGNASRLVANTTAATTPSTATTAARPPVRASALRPRPLGSSVIAIPTVADGGRPAATARRASTDGRRGFVRPWAPSTTTRCAAQTPRPKTTATTATPPSTSTAPSTSRPECGSARRAVPSGISGDSANAPTTASAAPTNATGNAASATVATRIHRDTPSDQRSGTSPLKPSATRRSTIATTTRPASPATTANTISPVVSTPIDCSTPPSNSDDGWTWNSPDATLSGPAWWRRNSTTRGAASVSDSRTKSTTGANEPIWSP